jgi:ubiquinone/menaquinone biosynthesis C-methylase UbiE
MTTPTHPPAPNHHAHHHGFTGIRGVVTALSMSTGRGPTARWVADTCEVEAGDTVIDIGCGPGAAIREAARRGATAVGVDPASVMLRFARALTLRRAPVSWRAGTAESLPIDDGAASVVWSLSTVHHWHDVDAGLHEVARVLGPDGRFLVTERRVAADADGLASHGWTAEQAATFASMCAERGFEAVEVEQVTVGRRALHVVRARRP